MSISPRFMQELRDRLTLSDIIGRRVKLTRAGREFKACCPFHHEKSPSFYVNDDKQFYHCFGCGAHGDAVGFMMQNGNLSFIEAVEALAAEAGLQVPQQSPQDIAQAKKQKDLYSLMDDTAKFFESALREAKHRDALAYMKERGLSEELIAAFRLGFSPADEKALHAHLKEKGYTDAQMIEAGVVRESKRGTVPYSFFRDRVMFPVADKRGRIVAFGARVLPEHLRPIPPGGGKPPKYINSAETPLFHKGRMLYGESHARQAAAEGKPVIVVEGYLDVIACSGAGFRGAVAPLGTALTEEQILALWKMIPGNIKIPVMCFDGDSAGRRAAARACERLLPLLKPDHSASFVFLPEGQDPDSLIRGQGAGAFGAALNGALSLADFLWAHHVGARRLETPEDRAGLEKTLQDETDKIADRTVQIHYKQVFRDRLYQAFRPVKNTNYGKGGKKGGAAPLPVAVRAPAFTGAALAGQIMLATVINHPALFPTAEETLAQMRITGHDRFDALRQALLSTLGMHPDLDSATLQNHLKEQGFDEELSLILSEAVYTHAGFARPSSGYEKTLEGWAETCKFLGRKAAWGEMQSEGLALAGDFSAERERKIIALYDMQKTSEG